MFIVFGVVILWSVFGKKKEGFQDNIWNEKAMEEFYKRFFRPIDRVHTAYYDNLAQGDNLNKSTRRIMGDLDKYEEQVKRGQNIASKSRLVITGLIRNNAYQIPEIKQRCQDIVKYFSEYKILIVENNSTDGSRDFLLEWSSEDPNVNILCKDIFAVNENECDILDFFPPSDHLGGSPLPDRIQKMAFLRNIYIKHTLHYYSNYDFMFVIDFDLRGDLYIDGFLQSVAVLTEQKKIDGIACNGMLLKPDADDFYYYDSFAHIDEGDPIYWENHAAKSNHDKYVHTYVSQRYKTNMNLDKVRSAFGGAALYKISSMKNAQYDFSSAYFSCEHSFFHKNKHIVVNPRFIFMISQNGA